MKARIAAGAIALALAMSLAACSPAAAPTTAAPTGADTSAAAPASTAPAAGEKITVMLPKHEMDTVGFNAQATKDFTTATGIQVELINMGWDDVADKVTTDLTTGGGTYDVIEFDNSWVQKFINNDWLESLDSYVPADTKAGIVPGLIDKFSVGGKLYGIPWNNDTRFFMYNQKMLTDAGVAKVPQTWDELVQASKKVQAKGVPFGWADSYMQAQSGGNEIVALVYSFGGEFFDASGAPVVGTDANTKAAFEFLVKAMKEDKVVNPASLTADYQTIQDGFTSGKAAFFIQAWPGVFAAANDAKSSTIAGQVAVADSAIHATNAKQAVLTLPEAMAIPKTSKHKDAAWKYIEYMSSRTLDKKRSEAIGSLPIWTDLLSDADLTTKYPYWANFANQITFARGLPNLTWYDQFNNALMTETQAMLSGGKSVADALAELQKQCEQLAADNK